MTIINVTLFLLVKKLNVNKVLIDEAKQQGNSWLPIKAGLFHSDIKRFEQVASRFLERLNDLSWF